VSDGVLEVTGGIFSAGVADAAAGVFSNGTAGLAAVVLSLLSFPSGPGLPARVASGHIAAAPPSSVMNLRRFN